MARGILLSGANSLLRLLPQQDVLLVLNYHRIGNSEDDLFDPGVFSATSAAFERQVSWLRRHVSVVTLEEALAFVDGSTKDKTPRCRVLLTFDDGYLDNYEAAFPILRSYGVQGVFFLATGIVGSCHIPWWDHIAYVVKTARKRRFLLRYPSEIAVNIDENGILRSLENVLAHYKKPENTDPARFVHELKEAAQGDDPPGALRRFLDWSEAREMVAGGMAIGSHTHSHPVLSQLPAEMQRRELFDSRAEIKEHLGIDANVLAYPVGAESSFSDTTQDLAREEGYRSAFSFHGGTNLPGKTHPYDVKRISVGGQSWPRFRVQAQVCRCSGWYWP